MSSRALRTIAPYGAYGAGLALAAALFVYAGQIDYTPRAGQIGPAVWPRLALALMASACLFEIVRRLARSLYVRLTPRNLEREDESEAVRKHPQLLLGGIVLVLLYAVLVPVLGFLLTTFLFIISFIYLGRYRNHGAVWATGAAITALCGILFLRVAYVSLPRGTPPFDRVTDAFFMIPGF